VIPHWIQRIRKARRFLLLRHPESRVGQIQRAIGRNFTHPRKGIAKLGSLCHCSVKWARRNGKGEIENKGKVDVNRHLLRKATDKATDKIKAWPHQRHRQLSRFTSSIRARALPLESLNADSIWSISRSLFVELT